MLKNLKLIIMGKICVLRTLKSTNPYQKRVKKYRKAKLWYKQIHKYLIPPILYVIFFSIKDLFKDIILYKVKEVSLKEIYSYFEYCVDAKAGEDLNPFTVKNLNDLDEQCHYNFKILVDSMKKYGIPGVIRLYDKPKNDSKYYIQDGNHRIFALKYLYGNDYKIKVLLASKVRSYKTIEKLGDVRDDKMRWSEQRNRPIAKRIMGNG